MCDDFTKVYFDGVKQKDVKGHNKWRHMVTYTVPRVTKEIILECKNRDIKRPYGIKAQFVNAKGESVSETGKSWSCSTSYEGGYKPATIWKNNHNENWKDQAGNGEIIWTESGNDQTAYCKFDLPPYKLEVLCDDQTTLFYDGKEQPHQPGDKKWKIMQTYIIPRKTTEFTIGCHNKVTPQPNGIKAELFDGEGILLKETDGTWQCSTTKDGVYKPATIEHLMHAENWPDMRGGKAKVIWTPSIDDANAFCKIVIPAEYEGEELQQN